MSKGSPQSSFYGTPSGLSTNYTPAPIVANRAPASTDIGYPLGQIWVDKTNGALYGLSRMVSGGSDWEILGSSTGQVATETGDSGTATPAAGNIKHAGTASQITTAAAGSTVTYSLPAAITTPGSLTTTTTLTGGTGVTATTGNISASAGNVQATGNVIASKSAAGANVTVQATNSDNTSGTSNGGVEIATGGASSGDPYLSFQISGVAASTMTMGLDNSASDLFVISNSASIGTSNALTLSQAGALQATTSVTAGTTLTATLGNITATNGNLVLNTAGNKIVSTSVGSGAAAGANSFGSATLTGGTVTVSTTAVTASSLIYIWRQSIGATGAAALGHLTVGTIVASTSFVINAVQAADATALQASDVSVIGWMIVN